MFNKNLFAISIGLFLGIAILLFVASWLFLQITSSGSDILAGRQEVADAAWRQNGLLDFQQNAQLYQPIINQLNTGFVDAKNPVDLFQFLENTAAQLHLVIHIALANADTEKNPQAPLAMTIDLQGSFPDVLAFTSQIENSSYFMSVQKMSVVQYSPQSQTPQPQIQSHQVQAVLLAQAVTK